MAPESSMPPFACLFIVLASRASAATCNDGSTGTDADGDGWCTVDTPDSDCSDDTAADPDAASIHPAAAEDGVDATDDDCDGSASVRREFVTAFESPFFVSQDMAHANATVSGGKVRLSPTATDAAFVRLRQDLEFSTGRLTITAKVSDITASSCRLRASDASGSTYAPFSTTGVHTAEFPGVAPGETLTWAGVECPSGTGYADVDWMTVQNGA